MGRDLPRFHARRELTTCATSPLSSPRRPDTNVPMAYVIMKAVSICERITLSTPASTSSILTFV